MTAARRWLLPATMTAVVMIAAPLARSQTASPVIQLLLTAHDARTRVQAAITLGRLRPPGTREALERALQDGVPAVRAAAVQSLVTLGDDAALAALRAHTSDRDDDVRAGIAHAISELESHRATGPGNTTGGPAYAGGPANYSSARFVVSLGTLSDRAGARPGIVDVLRNAIVQEMSRGGDVAVAPGPGLPPEAELRIRAGRARAFALEGSVNALRRWTVANTLSVRAEVSLVLMTQQSRTIVGSLSGAATAQDHTPYYDSDGFAQRLEDRALTAAVHGALGNLGSSLAGGP